MRLANQLGNNCSFFSSFTFIRKTILRSSLIVLAITAQTAFAKQLTIFGPETFVRDTGKPVNVINTFTNPYLVESCLIKVYNRGINNNYQPVSSAVIALNGSDVFTPNQFKPKTTYLEKTVTVLKENTLAVEDRSKPGSALTVIIECASADIIPPSIIAEVTPAANEHNWHNTDASVTFICSDQDSGIAFCSAPVVVSNEGADQVIEGVARDVNTNEATTSVTIHLDKTLPGIQASQSPQANAQGWHNDNVTIHYICNDGLSGIQACPAPVIENREGEALATNATAIDKAGNLQVATTTLNIDKTAPQIIIHTPIDGTTVREAAITVTGSITDAHLRSATLNGLSLTLAADNSFSLPLTLLEGLNQIQVNAADIADNASSQIITINYQSNLPPEITSTAITTAEEGSPYSYAVTTTDPDGDVVTLSLTTAPSGMSMDANGVISWLPDFNQAGEYNVVISATDGEFTVEQSFTLTVVNVNRTPSITSAAITDTGTGASYQYLVTAIDPDNDVISYSLQQAPANMSISVMTGEIFWQPSINDIGWHLITIVAMDYDGLVDTQTYMLAVSSGVQDNNPPKIISTPLLSVQENQSYIYDVDAIDPEGDVLSYELQQAPQGMSISVMTGEISWSPTIPEQLGRHTVSVYVQDLKGAYTTQNFIVEVLGRANLPPIITSTPVNIAKENQVYSYNVDAQDPDGDTVVYRLHQAPNGMTIHPDTGVISWIPKASAAVESQVTVTADDQRTGLDSQTFTIKLNLLANNQPPEIISVPVVSVKEGDAYYYDIDAQDPEADELTYSKIVAPENALINENNGVLSWIAEKQFVQSNALTNNQCRRSFENVGVFDPVVKWTWQGTQEYPDVRRVFGPVAVGQLSDDNNDGDINNLDTPDLVFPAFNDDAVNRHIVIVNGDDGATRKVINEVSITAGSVTLADIDSDGVLEILAMAQDRNGVYAFEHNGELKWFGSFQGTITGLTDAITVADINADGVPEISVGNVMLDNSGLLLWVGTGDKGGFDNYGYISIVADIDLDGSPEIIAGRTVYNADGTIQSHQSGVSADGYTAIGNFDEDNQAEIVLVSNGYVYLLNHNSVIIWGGVPIPGGGVGGAPTIADVDGDGEPEITVAGKSSYIVLEKDGSIKWQYPIFDLGSNRTGSSVFDFENDGKAEILYADERYFYIFDGASGEVLYSTPNESGTQIEYPVIADIDNDGHAEVVVGSSGTGTNGFSKGLRVFENNGVEWVSTRSIWNQHAYSINNINNDGTVPAQAEKSWLTHNTFRLNTFPDRSPLDLPDFRVGHLVYDDTAEVLSVAINNRGLALTESAVTLNIYSGDPGAEGVLLGTQSVSPILPNNSIEVIFNAIAPAQLTDNVWAVLDVPASVEECITDNNYAVALPVVVRAKDSQNLSGQQVFLLNVDDVNDAPQITSEITNTTAQLGSVYEYQVIATDADVGDALTYTLIDAPEGASINPQTGQFVWTPSSTSAVSYTVIVEATDLNGASTTQEFTINVYRPLNNRPLISSSPIENVQATNNYQYAVVATDTDGDILTYSLQSAPQDMSIDAATGVITWQTDTTYIGAYEVSIVVSDGNSGFAYQNYLLEVSSAVNQQPVITSTPIRQAVEGVQYIYHVNASDPDGDSLTYGLSSGPQNMSIDSGSGQVLWVPGNTDIGTHSVTVFADDGRGGSGAQTFLLLVTETIAGITVLEPGYSVSTCYAASNGLLNEPASVAFDHNGDMLIANSKTLISGVTSSSQGNILKVDQAGNQQVFSTDRSLFFGPLYIALSPGGAFGFEGDLFVGIEDNNEFGSGGTGSSDLVVRVPKEGGSPVLFTTVANETIVVQFGQGDSFGDDLFVSGRSSNSGPYTLYRVNSLGEKTVFNVFNSDGPIYGALSVAFGPGRNWGTDMYISAFQDSFSAPGPNNQHALYRIDQTGSATRLLLLNTAIQGVVFNPLPATLFGDHLYYFASNSVYKMDSSGNTTKLISGFQFINHLAFAPDGSLCVTDPILKSIIRIAPVPIPNEAPQITSLPILNATPEAIYNYKVDVLDINIGDVISYSLNNKPAGMNIDTLTGEITWAPGIEQLGTHYVSVVVTDSAGASDRQTFSVEVTINTPPVITSLPFNKAFAGAAYEYYIEAIDPENIPLTFSLEAGPEGMVIDETTGHVIWPEFAFAEGNHIVRVRAIDTGGLFDEQEFTVSLNTINHPPVITSLPVFNVVPGSNYQYLVQATDEDGDSLSFQLIQKPSAMTINPATGVINWSPQLADLGSHTIVVQVSDTLNAYTQQGYSLTVTENGAPQFTSVPPTSVNPDQLYQYPANAQDPEGSAVSYQLLQSPTGMSIDSVSGLVSWTPTAAQTGIRTVTLSASDGEASTSQTYNLSVGATSSDNLPPYLKGAPPVAAVADALYRYSIDATDDNGDAINYSLVSAPPSMTIDNNGVIEWLPTLADVGPHTVVFRIDDSRLYSDITYTLVVDAFAPPLSIDINISPEIVLPGEAVTISVSTIGGNGSVATQATVNGNEITLTNNGSAIFIPEIAGRYDILVTAVTVDEAVVKEAYFSARVDGDSTAPTVVISTPSADNIITAPTAIIGTVSDANLAEYTVVLRRQNSTQDQVIARSNRNVNNGQIAIFDPSLQLNGQYVIIVQATDINGQTSSDSVNIQVEGDLKVGNFSITLEDLNVPLAGLPIRVTRTYDSRRRHENLDFGYGWSVGYQDVRVEESRSPGAYWSLNEYPTGPLGILTRYCVEPQGSPVVTVTLPTGDVEKFETQASPRCNDGTPFLDVQLAFNVIGDTQSTLEAVDDKNGRLYQGNLVDLGNPDVPLNPNRYKLTTRAGYEYHLDQNFGIEKVIDPNGHTLTYSNEGIVHSSGKRIDFVRDSQGRITSVIDPLGQAIHYQYNTQGDLSLVRERDGAETTHTYNNSHGLLDIIDPLGRNIVKNIYDDNGRLIAQEDSDGNRTDFNHDIEGRQSIVTDRLGRTTLFYYDDRGNVTSQVDALNQTSHYTHDARGNQLSQTDPLGNITSATFNDSNDQLSQTDALGNTVNFSYNTRGQELTISDARGNAFANTYDSVGNLLSVTDPEGNTAGNNINAKGLVSKTTDAEGNTTTYTYDIDGNKLTETNALGDTTTYTYDENANILSETRNRTLADGSSVNESTTYAYDSRNRVIQTTDALGNITASEYDLAGQQIATIDALGRRTEMDYDAYGRLITTRYPDGSFDSNAYDAEGNLLTNTDRLGRVTTYTYDALNRQTSTTAPDGSITQTEYDAAGRVSANIDARLNRTTYSYDAAGRRTRVTDALGNSHNFSYDADGNLVSETDANGHTTTYTYNALDQRLQTTYHNASTTGEAFDALSRRTGMTDQAGITTTYAYDALGRLTTVTDAQLNTTTFSYDQAGNKLSQTDAEGRTTRWTYDALGRVLSRTLPLGQQEHFAYDEVGNLRQHTDFNGQTTTHSYDNNNRLTNSTYADGNTDTFTYNTVGNRLTATSTQGTTSQTTHYTYDPQNRLLQETQPDGSVLDYTYDANGNRSQVSTTHKGQTTTTDYGYDSLNRLQSVTDQNGTTTYGYDNVGNRQSVNYPNGSSETYTYDNLNRLTKKQTYNSSGALVQSYDYTLHPTGRRSQIEELTGRSTAYSYDNLYRLIEENITDTTNGHYQATYQYDKVGNRTYETVNGVQTQYTVDANDRLTQQGGTTYSYDQNGNTLTETQGGITTIYTYDSKNKLINLEKAGVSTQYGYNTDGIRTAKTEAGTTTSFIVDSNRDYAQVLIEDNTTSTVHYTYGDDLISQNRETGTSFYHYDGLGSTRGLSDNAGVLTDTYDYEAFGEVLNRTGATENSYLFAGEQFDSNLDQYYLRARYYNQSVGRFTQMDTWVGNNFDPTTLHKYLYANADPGNMIDPNGRFSIFVSISSVSIHSTIVSTSTRFVAQRLFMAANRSVGMTLASGGVAGAGVGLMSTGFKLRNHAVELLSYGLTGDEEKYARSLYKFAGSYLTLIGGNVGSVNDIFTFTAGIRQVAKAIANQPRVSFISRESFKIYSAKLELFVRKSDSIFIFIQNRTASSYSKVTMATYEVSEILSSMNSLLW